MSFATVTRANVDDKNEAVDVLVKASFLVCERFPRYKNTDEVKPLMQIRW